MTITLRVAFPPTNNSIWRSVKGRNILSARYRAWRELAAVQIDNQMIGQTPITGLYHAVIELQRPDKRGRDVSNYAKAIEDSLVLCRVIRDDSDCLSLMMKWADRKPGKGAEAIIELEAA